MNDRVRDVLYDNADCFGYDFLDEIIRSANINIRDENECTLLHHLSRKYRIYALSVLLEAGMDPNAQNMEGDTALMIAAEHNFLGIAKMLLRYGAESYIKNSKGYNAIMIANRCNSLDVGEILNSFSKKEEDLKYRLYKNKEVLRKIFR